RPPPALGPPPPKPPGPPRPPRPCTSSTGPAVSIWCKGSLVAALTSAGAEARANAPATGAMIRSFMSLPFLSLFFVRGSGLACWRLHCERTPDEFVSATDRGSSGRIAQMRSLVGQAAVPLYVSSVLLGTYSA